MAVDEKKLQKLKDELQLAQDRYDAQLAEHNRVQSVVNTVFDRDSGKTYWEISCPKHRKDPLLVIPSPKGLGFKVAVTSGTVPESLRGNWTRVNHLIDEVKNYLEYRMRPTLKSEKVSKKDK